MDDGFEDEEFMFLSQQQSMFLIKTIMGWFEDQNRFNSIDENINSELCQLLNILLISLCEVSGSHWDFIIDYCIYNLKVNKVYIRKFPLIFFFLLLYIKLYIIYYWHHNLILFQFFFCIFYILNFILYSTIYFNIIIIRMLIGIVILVNF